MAFNPDEYLSNTASKSAPAQAGFDPDAYLSKKPSDGFDPDAYLKSAPKQEAKQAPTERPEDQSIFRQVADVPLQIQKGYVTGVRLIADAFGANNPVSGTLRNVENFIGGMLSAQSKQDAAEMERISKEAQDKGVMDQVVAGFKALSVAPVDTVVNALGTSAPTMIAAIVGRAPAAGAVGALQGAGTIKSAVYDSVKEAYANSNLSPEEIEKKAVAAQEYFGPNLDMIATGAGLGVLEAITGSQATVKRIADNILKRKVAASVAANVAEEATKKSIAGSVVGGAFKDAVPEFFQGSQEQLSRNIASQREGFDTPTMRGVITQGVLEAGAGAVMGGVTSGVEAGAERREVNNLKTKLDELQGTPPPPGSDEERVLQVAAELVARGNVDQQNAQILARKIVADEKILGEKVDGPKPAEATGNAPLFIFDTPEQAQERAELLKRNRPKDNFEVQGTPDGKFAIFKVPVETTGGANVTAPIPEAGGVSTGLPSEAGARVPAGGAVTPVTDGLGATGAVAEQPVVGEAVQPAALTPAPVLTVEEFNKLEETWNQADANLEAATEQLNKAKAAVEDSGYKGAAKEQKKLYAELNAAEARYNEARKNAETAFNNLTQLDTAVTTPTEEPSVVETPKAIEAEAEGQAEPAAAAAPKSEEVISAPEAEAQTAIDEVNAAVEELKAARDQRAAEAGKREKGKGEPAELRRMTQKASEQLEAAISGTGERPSGLIRVIQKLNVQLEQARAGIEPYGGEKFDEGLLRRREDTTEEDHAQDIADMETAYAYYNSVKAARTNAIRSLAEFEANPVFDRGGVHPAKAKALEFMRTLPYEDKLAAYKDISEKTKGILEADTTPEKPVAEAKPPAAPVVTVKKKRRLEIPPVSQQRKVRKGLATSLRTDPTFAQFNGKSITEALAHIATTGNTFERALATRLLAKDNRGGIKDTKMYVLDEEGIAGLEGTEADITDANGLYYLGEKGDAIFLRGEQFEENGINNQTVLHEALHSTVNKRLIYGLYARELGLPVPPELERTVVELSELMSRAETALDQYLADNKEVSADIQALIDGGAFDTITEFVAYGMTDPAMQRFLRDNVEGVVTKTNGLTDFVRLVLDMLGLGPEHTSGLRDLIEYTNKLAASIDVRPETARAVLDISKDNQVANIEATSKAAKRKQATAAEITKKVEDSASADQLIEELGSLSTVAKNPKLWGEYLKAKFSDINFDAMNVLLASMPTNMVVEMGVDKGITRLADVDTDVREMATMRTRLLNRVQEVATPWIKLSPAIQKQLGKVMAQATLAQVDPATEMTADKTLYDMYKALTPDAKAVYKNVRDFYKDQYDLYQALLERAAKRMGGDEKAAETLATIKALYEKSKNKGPYFPLMRYGQFYARFGKGDSKEFYMFESAGLRDAFVTRKMAELAKKGEKRTFEQMMQTDDVDRGNDVEGMRREMLKDNMQLQNVFNLIDKASSLGDEKVRAALKDQIYQMQLMSLPEASMRKHFIHRKGYTGFSGDALRNFLNSGTRMASQMARVRYGTDIANNLRAAKESLKGNPEKDKLEALVKEVEARTNDELNPPIDDTFLERMARRTNKVAFLYMLTSAKSAANQMFSLLNFTLPTLAARHGWVPAMKEMGKYLAMGYGQMGVVKTNIDGTTSWVAPSIALSERVAKNPEEQYAVQRMQDMGVSDATRTYDLFLRRNQASADYNSRFNQVTNMMGALFHHSERISREITFMTSFRLAIDKGMTKEQAVEQAVNDTNTALFDYSAWNRPRVLRPAPVRMFAQFKQFPMYVTLYLGRNGYNMIKSGATAQERKEAATMLFGTLGMTALMAGASGSFGYSVIMGVIQGIRNALRDDDEEDPLEEKDFELWFRNVYLPELCGDTTIMGMKLSELIDSGVLNTATGYDVASGISLNNLWFHDTPDANRWKDGFDNLLISIMGPGVSVGRQVAGSIDDFNNGEFLKGTEKLLPAFFRGTATAIRYDQEGALSSTGAEIKAKEDFTKAQLIAQAAGFRTSGLSQVMNNNFAIQQMINGLKNDRANLMKRLDTAIVHGSDEDIEDVLDDIDEFGGKYPTYRIKYSEIASSMKAREKIRRQSDAGLYLDKRSRDFDILRDRVLDNLEREAAR